MKLRIAWAAPLLLLAAAAAADDENDAALAEGARTCVPLQSISRTDVIDDRTILFYVRGGEIYVNRLPRRCPGLKRADSFMYETSLSQLCNVDIITVLRRFGPGFNRGASCGLGVFEPISAEAVAALKEAPAKPEPEAVTPEIQSPDDAEDTDPAATD